MKNWIYIQRNNGSSITIVNQTNKISTKKILTIIDYNLQFIYNGIKNKLYKTNWIINVLRISFKLNTGIY